MKIILVSYFLIGVIISYVWEFKCKSLHIYECEQYIRIMTITSLWGIYLSAMIIFTPMIVVSYFLRRQYYDK